MAEFKLTDIRKFFGYATLKEFSDDWKSLSDKDKADIKSGLIDGTMTY